MTARHYNVVKNLRGIALKKYRYWFFVLLLSSAGVLAQMELVEVDDGIYVHFGRQQLSDSVNRGAVANIGFIVGGSCVAVIDTGGSPEQGYALRAAIKKVSKKPVCYVINTHVHPDHIYGNSAFNEAGVTFIGHHKLARAMALRGDYYTIKIGEQLGLELTAKHLIPPTKAVHNHLLINLGGRELVLTARPTAHTDNDLTVFDKKTNTLWLSDLLFVGHLPVIDGSLKGWLAVLNDLEKRSYKTVIAGHGQITGDWLDALRAQKIYLQKLYVEIRQMLADGQFLEHAIARVGYSERGNWLLFEQFHRRNVGTAFAELEWED